MKSRSCSNLIDLAAGNFPNTSREQRLIPWVRSVPGNVSELACGMSSDKPSIVPTDRMIIVSNQLPVKAMRQPGNEGWSFSWNEDSLVLQLKDGFPEDMEVFFVGSLQVDVAPKEQDEVSQILLDRFKSVPTFLPPDILTKFYDGFCKKQLWPLFHYMLPLFAKRGNLFDQSLWEAYVVANKVFAQKVVEVIDTVDDFVWIHDYHLMVLPTFLRKRIKRIKMGFFLHCPFPSSEIYRTLPVGEEIMRALLNTDLIGFHTFDYARHFLSTCSRMLGLEYESKRGYLALEYYGRTIGIKIMPVGVHMGRIHSVMKLVDKECWVGELRQQFEGKIVLLGVDDMDIFKGINLKLLAMEHMLRNNPKWRGRAVLVQIVNPARGRGIDLSDIRVEIQESCRRINDKFRQPGYEPLVLIDRPISISERIAYYSIAECVVVTALRDGMNLTPYEYVVCRHGLSGSESCTNFSGSKKSMLVMSEFLGCSPSLSGAIRVNPWNIEATAAAMIRAISASDTEKQLLHEKHCRYIRTHDVAYWSRSFLQDLKRNCAHNFWKKCWGVGIGFGFKVVALEPNFRKLSVAIIVSAYKRAKSRVILLDYDGTVMSQNSINKSPSGDVISILNKLNGDLKNTVFIVSGRSRDSLSKWFSPCRNLGIAAEHGYFLRWSQDEEWKTYSPSCGYGWMQVAEPVMKLYTEVTDGSSIEIKETALVWQYRDADPTFGSEQAKEMLDHLESVLANEPVVVTSGQFIVEVKPQGVSKGLVAEKIFKSMDEKGKQADLVLCIGDDRSDEDMFKAIDNALLGHNLSVDASVFACTVGQKPSKAKYYLDDTAEVVSMLESLAEVSEEG